MNPTSRLLDKSALKELGLEKSHSLDGLRLDLFSMSVDELSKTYFKVLEMSGSFNRRHSNYNYTKDYIFRHIIIELSVSLHLHIYKHREQRLISKYREALGDIRRNERDLLDIKIHIPKSELQHVLNPLNTISAVEVLTNEEYAFAKYLVPILIYRINEDV